MDRLEETLLWVIEIGVLAWLVWSAQQFYILFGGSVLSPVLVIVVYAPITHFAWRALRKRLGAARTFRLVFITGLSLALSIFMAVRVSWELTVLWQTDRTKEMAYEAYLRGVQDPPQWYADHAEKVRTERNAYVAVAGLLCVYLWRSKASNGEASKAQEAAQATPTGQDSH